MTIIIQHNGRIPIYEQIVDQIKRQILKENLQAETKLPSVRVLAKDLRISALTVKKAYDQLEAEGFIETVHGKGSFILPVNAAAKKEEVLVQTQEGFEKVMNKAYQAGITIEEMKEIVTLLIEEKENI
ncbi:MAG TPA: GntR family transcriptional regulator [Candidatus Tetragenococcus pullicola]|nr:GntR family transcriptional regulator [Candidatus Tetragenococcus pullicola]